MAKRGRVCFDGVESSKKMRVPASSFMNPMRLPLFLPVFLFAALAAGILPVAFAEEDPAAPPAPAAAATTPSEATAKVEGTFASPDGKRHAEILLKANHKRVVVIDGVEGPEFDFISCGPVFSAGGRHVAYYGPVSYTHLDVYKRQLIHLY